MYRLITVFSTRILSSINELMRICFLSKRTMSTEYLPRKFHPQRACKLCHYSHLARIASNQVIPTVLFPKCIRGCYYITCKYKRRQCIRNMPRHSMYRLPFQGKFPQAANFYTLIIKLLRVCTLMYRIMFPRCFRDVLDQPQLRLIKYSFQ